MEKKWRIKEVSRAYAQESEAERGTEEFREGRRE